MPSDSEYCNEDEMPDVRPKYKIEIFGESDSRRVIEVLFSYGYVWDAILRYKTFDKVYNYYTDTIEEWKYITTHFDRDCKMVIGKLSSWEWNAVLSEYKTVTLDEFLYTIVGHEKKPVEEKKVITIPEFNKEFENFQRRTYPTVEFNRPAMRRVNNELVEVDRINDQIMNEALEGRHPPIGEGSTTPRNSVDYMNLVLTRRDERRRRRRVAIRTNNDA